MSFEQLVRPFESTRPFRSRLQPVPAPSSPVATTTTWEGSADATWTEEEPGLTTDFKAEYDEDKTKRQSHQVKVVNPDDESQHVFVERVDSFTFNDQKTKKELKLNFNWD